MRASDLCGLPLLSRYTVVENADLPPSSRVAILHLLAYDTGSERDDTDVCKNRPPRPSEKLGKVYVRARKTGDMILSIMIDIWGGAATTMSLRSAHSISILAARHNRHSRNRHTPTLRSHSPYIYHEICIYTLWDCLADISLRPPG